MAERFSIKSDSDLLEEFDLVRLRKLRSRLCKQLDGTEEMDRIDRLFYQGFMTVSPMACWLQGVTDALLGDLLSQDKESFKYVFQLLLGRKS